MLSPTTAHDLCNIACLTVLICVVNSQKRVNSASNLFQNKFNIGVEMKDKDKNLTKFVKYLLILSTFISILNIFQGDSGA